MEGKRIDNITNWGLEQFRIHYNDTTIDREAIFHYVYSVFHNPEYRKTYKYNLQRHFPRIPFYKDFHKWATLGSKLMDLHIHYETIEPYPLKREDISLDYIPFPKLRAYKLEGEIAIDEGTLLRGIPSEAWEYQSGGRSALEWVLDQYKEKKIKDKTIRDRFNGYKFADYKEDVIMLLKRVCRVSVETMRLVKGI